MKIPHPTLISNIIPIISYSTIPACALDLLKAEQFIDKLEIVVASLCTSYRKYVLVNDISAVTIKTYRENDIEPKFDNNSASN